MIALEVALATLQRLRRDEDVVITTMAAAKVWMDQGTHPRDFVFVPSCMGHATSIGLGLALAQPKRRVIVCNGDGSMLMNLGSLVTIAAQAPANLAVLVFDNGVYEVTGAQPTPARMDFAAIARASGWPTVHRVRTAEEWSASAREILDARGPVFVWVETEAQPGRPGPRSPGPAAERARVFMRALGTVP